MYSDRSKLDLSDETSEFKIPISVESYDEKLPEIAKIFTLPKNA